MQKPEIVQDNVDLREYSWWKVGGVAQHFAAPSSIEELKSCVEWAVKSSLTINIFSGATNVLFYGGTIKGLLIGLSNFSGTEVVDEGEYLKLESWAGSPKADLLKFFLKYKLDPALFLTGLPGDIGGGIAMNAGIGEQRVPREFCEITDWIEVLSWDDSANFEVKRYDAENLEWTYRSCKGWQPGIIVKAGFKWKNAANPDLMKMMREATRKRVTSQPLDKPSCGSVFRNPEGHHSAKLIQDCGLKGYTIGGASVSEKHANFIVNNGDATASDVSHLIDYIKEEVLKKHGVDLQQEVVYLGWP